MITTHPDVRSAAFNRLAGEREVRQAKSNYFPKLDLDIGAGKTYVEKPVDVDLDPIEAALSLRQNIVTGLETTMKSPGKKQGFVPKHI